MLYRDHNGLYVAECIDLDLMVKRDSEEASRHELLAAITAHVKVAIELGDESLLDRPSPLSHRLRYEVYRFAHVIAHRLVHATTFSWEARQQICHC